VSLQRGRMDMGSLLMLFRNGSRMEEVWLQQVEEPARAYTGIMSKLLGEGDFEVDTTMRGYTITHSCSRAAAKARVRRRMLRFGLTRIWGTRRYMKQEGLLGKPRQGE